MTLSVCVQLIFLLPQLWLVLLFPLSIRFDYQQDTDTVSNTGV